jgi:hypothetical protein
LSLTLRGKRRLRILENRVLRRDEVKWEWRRVLNEELYAVYSSPNIIQVAKSRRMRGARYVARMGESRGAYRVLVGELEGRRPSGRPNRRWENNIKMDILEIGYAHGPDRSGSG